MPVTPAIETDLEEVTSQLQAPCRFFYKKENQQPSGSFKLRGMSKVISQGLQEAKAQGKSQVQTFSSSGGNAGLAAAFTSRHHGISCTVVLPETSQGAIPRLETLGATVIVHGKHWGEADAYLRTSLIPNLASSVHAIYCHPFDDAVLCEGHASIVDEMAAQLPVDPKQVKGIVCSCGGGGLYSGIVQGLERNAGWEKVPVLVAETHQTDCFHQAAVQGKVVHLRRVVTLSTSLGSPYVSQRALDYYNAHDTVLCQMDDLDAVRGTVHHYDTFHELTEPACGATMAISRHRRDLLAKLGPLSADDVVIFVVCGGSTVSDESLAKYRSLLGEHES